MKPKMSPVKGFLHPSFEVLWGAIKANTVVAATQWLLNHAPKVWGLCGYANLGPVFFILWGHWMRFYSFKIWKWAHSPAKPCNLLDNISRIIFVIKAVTISAILPEESPPFSSRRVKPRWSSQRNLPTATTELISDELWFWSMIGLRSQ